IPTHGDGSSWRKLWLAACGLVRFAALAVRGDVDIAHIHFSSRASFYRKSLFIGVSRCFGIKLVGHANGSEFRVFYDQECGPLRRAFVRAALSQLDRLIAVSPQWQAFYAGLCPRLSCVVIGNPVCLPAAEDRHQAVPPIVVTLGRLGTRKGTYDTLKA